MNLVLLRLYMSVKRRDEDSTVYIPREFFFQFVSPFNVRVTDADFDANHVVS